MSGAYFRTWSEWIRPLWNSSEYASGIWKISATWRYRNCETDDVQANSRVYIEEIQLIHPMPATVETN
uniref:Uncharacterized protein n=1 Tax=Oryza nivara TaxID=4536 RepID=A0A0E0I6G4_ORYNI